MKIQVMVVMVIIADDDQNCEGTVGLCAFIKNLGVPWKAITVIQSVRVSPAGTVLGVGIHAQ